MEESGRPHKRAHVELGALPVIEVLRGDPWLSDGSIILRAINKTNEHTTHTHWKVHKSVLSHHSSFFRELFEGPHGTVPFDHASEQYDGVPVMDMQDKLDDVAEFLKVLYSPGKSHSTLKRCE